MHESTFGYLKPTEEQIDQMQAIREAAKVYADCLTENLPEGPDKTYVFRRLREVSMWANVAITRQADGTPR